MLQGELVLTFIKCVNTRRAADLQKWPSTRSLSLTDTTLLSMHRSPWSSTGFVNWGVFSSYL